MIAIEAIRAEILRAILDKPGESANRYALADLYEEYSDVYPGMSKHTGDLRLDDGLWVIVYRNKCYNLIWTAACTAWNLVPVRPLDGEGKPFGPYTIATRLEKNAIPRCRWYHHVVPRTGGMTQTCRHHKRIATVRSHWGWACPAAFPIFQAPDDCGVYRPDGPPSEYALYTERIAEIARGIMS